MHALNIKRRSEFKLKNNGFLQPLLFPIYFFRQLASIWDSFWGKLRCCYSFNMLQQYSASRGWEEPDLFLQSGQFKKILFRAYNFVIKSITRSLIIFKKPRKMTNDFFNHYVFLSTLQWTWLECLTNVTITVKVAMVTYIWKWLTKFDVRSVFRDLQTSKTELFVRTVHGWSS